MNTDLLSHESRIGDLNGGKRSKMKIKSTAIGFAAATIVAMSSPAQAAIFLLGITGNGANTPETLFELSTADASCYILYDFGKRRRWRGYCF